MKYAPNAIGIGELRKSSGSATASRNRYGPYIRARVVPVNPATDFQTDVRDFFAYLSQHWKELTESQRDAWSALSQEVPIVDSLGQTIVLAGNAFFAKVNILRNQVGFAIIDDAPALDVPPTVTSLTPTIDTTPTLSLAYAVTGGAAGNRVIVRGSFTRSPGRTFVGRGEMRQFTTFVGNAASPLNALAAYNARFGTGWQTQEGMEVVFEAQGVSANGLPGSIQRISAAIAGGA